MSRILLISTKDTLGYFLPATVEHLGLIYLYSYVRDKGHECKIIDRNIDGKQQSDFIKHAHNYDIIGFTVYSTNIESTKRAIKLLRENGYPGHITMGGHYVSLWPTCLSEIPDADSLIVGEGEVTLDELATAIERKLDWHQIDGLAYRDPKNNSIILSKPRSLIENLDFSFLLNRRSYNDSIIKSRSAYISTSRGCDGSCSYCSIVSFYQCSSGKRWRARSPESVIEEVHDLVENYSVEQLTFVDDNFLPKCDGAIERARQIGKGIKDLKKNISFYIEFRPRILPKGLFEELAQSGLSGVYLGLEAVTQRQQRLYRKHINLKIFKEILGELVDAKISPSVFSIFIDPWVTIEELQESIHFINEIGPEYFHNITSYLWPIHGTTIYNKIEKAGLLVGNHPITTDSKHYINTKFVHPEIQDVLFEWLTIRDNLELEFSKLRENKNKEWLSKHYRKMKKAIFENCVEVLNKKSQTRENSIV